MILALHNSNSAQHNSHRAHSWNTFSTVEEKFRISTWPCNRYVDCQQERKVKSWTKYTCELMINISGICLYTQGSIFPVHFPCVLITSHHLKTFRIMENNKQLCLLRNHKFGRHLTWCSIFYETITGSVFFVNYSIQGPFIKNKTAFIKMRHFSKRRFIAFGKNKGEAEAGAWYALRCDVFYETFHCLQRKKGDAGAAAFYAVKHKCTILTSRSWQTDWPWQTLKRK